MKVLKIEVDINSKVGEEEMRKVGNDVSLSSKEDYTEHGNMRFRTD